MSHLRAGAECVAAALHAVLDDKEASQLRDEGFITLQEVGRGR